MFVDRDFNRDTLQNHYVRTPRYLTTTIKQPDVIIATTISISRSKRFNVVYSIRHASGKCVFGSISRDSAIMSTFLDWFAVVYVGFRSQVTGGYRW